MGITTASSRVAPIEVVPEKDNKNNKTGIALV